jgi:hypothetical protein
MTPRSPARSATPARSPRCAPASAATRPASRAFSTSCRATAFHARRGAPGDDPRWGADRRRLHAAPARVRPGGQHLGDGRTRLYPRHHAPAAPAIDLTDSSDSGVSSSDNLTNDTTPTLSITGEGGSTLRLFEDGTLIATLAGRGGDVTVDSLAEAYLQRRRPGGQPETLQITIDTVPMAAIWHCQRQWMSATDKIDTTRCS